MSLVSSFFVWLLEFWTFGVYELCLQPGYSSRLLHVPVLWCFVLPFFDFLLIFWSCKKLLVDQELRLSWQTAPLGRLAHGLLSIPPTLDTPALESRPMLWLPPEENVLPVLPRWPGPWPGTGRGSMEGSCRRARWAGAGHMCWPQLLQVPLHAPVAGC